MMCYTEIYRITFCITIQNVTSKNWNHSQFNTFHIFLVKSHNVNIINVKK